MRRCAHRSLVTEAVKFLQAMLAKSFCRMLKIFPVSFFVFPSPSKGIRNSNSNSNSNTTQQQQQQQHASNSNGNSNSNSTLEG